MSYWIEILHKVNQTELHKQGPLVGEGEVRESYPKVPQVGFDPATFIIIRDTTW